jgi:anti-sigma factor RsiW
MKGEEQVDTKLHRYFDGDLPPEEAAALRRRLEADPVLRAQLDGLAEVRAVLRAFAEAQAGDVPSEALWERIEARLGGDRRDRRDVPETGTQPLRAAEQGAVDLIAMRDVPETGTQPPAKERIGKRAFRAIAGGRSEERQVTSSSEAGRRRTIGIVVAAVALAAAAFLVVLAPDAGGPESQASVSARHTVPDRRPSAEPTLSEIVQRTEVLKIDFGNHWGAIFAVEGQNGERYAVVWLEDEKTNEQKTTAME